MNITDNTKMYLSSVNDFDNGAKVQLIALKNDFQKYIHAALASSTRVSYQSDLAHFISWGGTIPSTPEIISQYLAIHADLLAPATLTRRVVSINRAHTSQNLPSPAKSDLVKATLRGIKRTVGTKQRQVSPVLKNNLIDMVAGLGGVKGCRDRALLLLGFAGAFRRSELVGLQFADTEFVEQGLVVHLSKSKTDQEGQGQVVAILNGARLRVVDALIAWLEAAVIDEGYLFRPIKKGGQVQPVGLTDRSVANIVKHYAGKAGLTVSDFSGHSLRAGFITSGAADGADLFKLMEVSRHRKPETVMDYVREANLFENHAGEKFL